MSGPPQPVSGENEEVATVDPAVLAINDTPVPDTGSERSRSERGIVALAPMGTDVMSPPSHAGFNHRGPTPIASREGLPPALHQHNMTATYHHHLQPTQYNTLNQMQVNQVEATIHTHDPAVTAMVEELAEARHRERMAATEQAAEHAMRGQVQRLVEELNARTQEEEPTDFTCRAAGRYASGASSCTRGRIQACFGQSSSTGCVDKGPTDH